jgi:hypothetical protein
MGVNKRKKKKHADLFQAQLGALKSGEMRIGDLCHHAAGLKEGDRFQLGMRETLNYLGEISQLLERIEFSRSGAKKGE